MDESEPLNLLLVEDNDIDVMAFKRGLQRNGISNPLFVASNGVEALEFLRGENGRATITRPYVIFLDLNMPLMNGLEFLRQLRSDDLLETSVVFVLTTSAHERDIVQAYKEHVAGYIPKGNLRSDSKKLFEMISAYGKLVIQPPE